MLAETCRQYCRSEEDLGTITKARARRWEGELERIESESRRLRGASTSEIEGFFQRTLTVARGQCPKAFELQVSINLARLRRDQGKHAEGFDVLPPVYGWFTGDRDTPDLKEAKALLDELGGA